MHQLWCEYTNQVGKNNYSWSLATLAETHLHLGVDKGCQKANDKWEAETLTAACKKYAAADAYAQLRIYQRLMALIKPYKEKLKKAKN